MKNKIVPFIVFSMLIAFTSCETDKEKQERIAKEELYQIELEIKLEKIRIEREARIAQEKKEKAIYDKYINNTLKNGSTPYYSYFGGNSSCDYQGCSQIKVTTSNSDVIVTIKKDGKVVRHAYVRADNSYLFSFPNGTYQTFFYYGKGWNPDKVMNNGKLKGGFVANTSFGKDDPKILKNNILEYSLIMQEHGNFSTRPSNPEEAF